jgi:hypothetical protein
MRSSESLRFQKSENEIAQQQNHYYGGYEILDAHDRWLQSSRERTSQRMASHHERKKPAAPIPR